MLRRLIRELGGIAERDYIAKAGALTAKPLRVEPRPDRLAWIDRQEAAALNLARSRLSQTVSALRLQPFRPGDAVIDLREATTIVCTAVRRRFDLMRLEALR